METAPARRHQRRQNPFPGPGLVPATLHNPGALVPVAEGLSSTWPELTALTSRESCGSPARGWDLVLPCIPRMTPNHCFAGDQRSGLHGDAEAARHWHGGGVVAVSGSQNLGHSRPTTSPIPRSLAGSPGHTKPCPTGPEPGRDLWTSATNAPRGARRSFLLSLEARGTVNTPRPHPPSLQPRLSQQGKKQFVFIRAPRPQHR